MKLNGVHHIAVYPNAEKLEETINFYKNVLGMPEVRSWNDGKNVMLSCGDNTVMEIVCHPELTNERVLGSVKHLALATDDVDEYIETVSNLGYEIIMEPKDLTLGEGYNVRVAFCVGPVGEEIEFFKEY